jgi:hypothetical protein
MDNFKNIINSIISSFKYPILVKTVIVNCIITIITAITVAIEGKAIKRMVLIIASNLCTLVLSLFAAFNVDIAEDELQELTEAIHFEVQAASLSNKERLFLCKSKEEAIKFHKEMDLHREILLPNVEFRDIEISTQAKFLNRWIFTTYPVEFMAMWWGKEIDEIEYLFRLAKHNTYAGSMHESDGEKERNREFTERVRSGIAFEKIQLEHQAFNPVDIFNVVLNIGTKFVGVLLSYAFAKLTVSKFCTRDIFSGINLGKDVSNLTSTFTDKLTSMLAKEDPKAIILSQIEERASKLNSYLETPTHDFAANPQRLGDFRDYLVATEYFLRTIPKDFANLAVSLSGLYQAANVRKNEIYSSELPNYARQEPFVVLLRGPGGIGKTQLARDMARKIVNNLIANGNMAKDYIEVTPSDKYWPPLNGQRCALFDEAGTVQDYNNDLLFSGIKGICSPTFYNCAAADLTHKISPCMFQVIFATSNTNIIDIAGRIAAISSAESVYPCFRRMMVLECEWNESLCGKYRHNGVNRYRKDFSHLVIKPYVWNGETQTPLLEDCAPLTFDVLYGRISHRFKRMENDFAARLAMATAEQQNFKGSKMHYTVNMNGPGGHGKTPMSISLVDKLSSALRMPVIKLATKEAVEALNPMKEKAIVLCDDLVRNVKDVQLEQALMTLYNEKLYNNSILVFCTNMSPSYSWLPKPTPFGIIMPRAHPCENIGLTRRLGFKGTFIDGETPEYNDEFFVKHGDLAIRETCTFNWLQIALLFVTFIASYFFYPLCIAPMAYIWYKLHNVSSKSITFDDLHQYIFDRYNAYLQYRKQMKVVENQEAPKFEPNFRFYANHSNDIVVPTSVFELERYVYIHLPSFLDVELPWKFWLDSNLAYKLRSNYQRFICTVNGISEDTIIDVVERYAKAFLELGVEPRMSIEVLDLGRFDYVDGTLYVNRSSPMTEEVEAIMYGEFIRIGRTVIPIDDVFDVDNMVEQYQLNIIEASAISRLMKSKEFLSSSIVARKMRNNFLSHLSTHTQIMAKKYRDQVTHFFSQPLGRAIGVILAVASCGLLINSIYKYFTRRYDLDFERKTRTGTKKGDRNPRYLSDDDKQRQKKIGTARKNPRYLSDEEHQREDIMSKTDMNSYNAYSAQIGQVHPKVRKNMAMVYLVKSHEKKLDQEPIGQQSCYALFVGGKTFVTVGHVLDSLKSAPSFSLYVGSDEFVGYYKATLVQQYNMRDLSVWKIDDLPIQFPEIRKSFASKSMVEPNMEKNTVLERFAPGKTTQWIQGSMTFWHSPMRTRHGDLVGDIGYVDFATFGLKLTELGDCGLIYYYCDIHPYQNLLAGIHCMGNVEGYNSVGIIASIFREDVDGWLKLSSQVFEQNIPKLQPECTFCGNQDYLMNESPTPKVEGHEIIWSPMHESSPEAFYGECRKYFSMRPNFVGHIIKNSGPLGMGSVEHSHTQFLPRVTENLIVTNGWKAATCAELGISNMRMSDDLNCVYRVIDTRFPGIYTSMNTVKNLQNFRLYINIYVDAKNLRRATIKLIIISPELPVKQFELGALDREVQTPLRLPSDVEVYVPEDVKNIFENAEQLYKRNLLPDVPFEKVQDNETVTIIGTLKQSASRLPRPMYKRTPFSLSVSKILPIEKEPVEYDLSLAPKEILDTMAVNRYGDPDSRINQSIQWAHSITEPDQGFRAYTRNQFVSKIYQYYANLRPMTDKEVLEGYPVGHRYHGYISSLELDKSIGFTMKQLYHVQHKSDIIGKTPEGQYYWQENDAAIFAQEMYQNSKDAINQGKFHYSAFLELLKMEKLKTAKKHIGRTFVAQDLNGVLIERYALGSFAAKAMKDDPTCGVGTNAYDDFQRIFLDLKKFNNMFTGDYKRFDRTTPYAVLADVRDMLIQVNPHMSNEINSVFNAIINRIQISGTTVFQCLGGMPSGCTLTAPLNSMNNDYIIYSAFVALCQENNFDSTYISYDRNVVRKFYGDDVIVSVSDEIAGFFTMSTLSAKIKQLFGMTLDSSAKDGTLRTFETYDEASWISRFFRKLDKFQFYVGALKKISINAHFHYVTSLDPKHIGALFTTAQWEAALWEPEYFDQIHQAIRIAIARVPAVGKYFQFRARQDIQLDLFNAAQDKYACRQVCESVAPAKSLSDSQEVYSTFFDRYSFDKAYFRHIIKLCKKSEFDPSLRTVEVENVKYHTSMSFIMQLNESFQKGFFAKPEISYEIAYGVWECHINIREIYPQKGSGYPRFTSNAGTVYIGHGHSKSEAREEAAYKALKGSIPSWSPEFRKVLQTEEQKLEEQRNLARFAKHISERQLKYFTVKPNEGTLTAHLSGTDERWTCLHK